MIGTPLGVVKGMGVASPPDGQRFEAKAIEEMQSTPCRPSTRHRRTKTNARMTDKEDQGDDEEEEPEEIPH